MSGFKHTSSKIFSMTAESSKEKHNQRDDMWDISREQEPTQ